MPKAFEDGYRIASLAGDMWSIEDHALAVALQAIFADCLRFTVKRNWEQR
jgi:hypothetical protein